VSRVLHERQRALRKQFVEDSNCADVGIRALKQNASEVVRRAAAGDVITITDRGKPVARLIPLRKSKLDDMRDAGLITEATCKPWELPLPTAIVDGPNSLSEILEHMRNDERY
jgi:prevent-host-death family protein